MFLRLQLQLERCGPALIICAGLQGSPFSSRTIPVCLWESSGSTTRAIELGASRTSFSLGTFLELSYYGLFGKNDVAICLMVKFFPQARILNRAWMATIQVGMAIWKAIHAGSRTQTTSLIEDDFLGYWGSLNIFCWFDEGLKWRFTPHMFFSVD